MRKLNKTAACGILAAALAAGTLSGCSKAIDGTKTVATVGDEKVTLGLASYMVRDQQAQTTSYYNMLMSQYGVSGSASNVWDQKGDDGKTVGESSKDGVMTTINQLYVLKAHAADYDVTITDDEEKAIKEAAAEFIKDNDEKILKKLAVSEDDIVTYLELVTIRSKMHDPMTADVDTEVSANEKDQTRVTIVKVSTEGTEKDDDGNTIDLTDEEKDIVVGMFIENKDKLETILREGMNHEHKVLVLTEPLCDLETRKRIFRDIIAQYGSIDGEPAQILMKPHPRDVLDYEKEFSQYIILDKKFPMEILNYIKDLKFDRVISVLTVTDAILFAKEKLFLGEDFMDRYEAPEIHRQNEQIY